MHDVLRACGQLLFAKKHSNLNHLYAISALTDNATVHCQPTKDVGLLLDSLRNLIRPSSSRSPVAHASFDVGSLCTVSESLLVAARKTSHSTHSIKARVLMLYCRSNVVPVWITNHGHGLAVDVLYIHEKPMAGLNCPQEVFSTLEDTLDQMSRKADHTAYIFECSTSNTKKLLSSMVWILAHPALRKPQAELKLQPFDFSGLNTDMGLI